MLKNAFPLATPSGFVAFDGGGVPAEDAYLVASTCLKIDPFNAQVIELVNKLKSFRTPQAGNPPAGPDFARLQKAAGWDEWEQEHVYVIGHDNPGA